VALANFKWLTGKVEVEVEVQNRMRPQKANK
jgi:hypothetical protein